MATDEPFHTSALNRTNTISISAVSMSIELYEQYFLCLVLIPTFHPLLFQKSVILCSQFEISINSIYEQPQSLKFNKVTIKFI